MGGCGLRLSPFRLRGSRLWMRPLSRRSAPRRQYRTWHYDWGSAGPVLADALFHVKPTSQCARCYVSRETRQTVSGPTVSRETRRSRLGRFRCQDKRSAPGHLHLRLPTPGWVWSTSAGTGLKCLHSISRHLAASRSTASVQLSPISSSVLSSSE